MTALGDLRKARCDILTLGQYLQPSLKHLPVVEYVSPARFEELGNRARQMGFVHVASGPMVRSSYHADEFRLPSAVQELRILTKHQECADHYKDEHDNGD